MAISLAPTKKSCGPDNIYADYFKHPNLIPLITQLFRTCFLTSCFPNLWHKANILPVPKSGNLTDPLKYRGIALQYNLLKAYTSILNKQLTYWLEDNEILVQEQLGFRSGHNCLEHALTVYLIAQNRKIINKDTFICFIDLKKAFDSVDRNLLWYKLLCYGINDNLLENLKALYSRVNYCLKINGTGTECFTVNRGVKQGCLLSPALFNLYINDLVPYVKNLNLGVNTEEDIVMCILLYADDIALFAKNENDLQLLICKVATWCDKNRLAMNINKTKILHIRPNKKSQIIFSLCM